MSIFAAAPEGPETFNSTAGLLRLRTLVRLRWLAVLAIIAVWVSAFSSAAGCVLPLLP
jgi:hypothetical protein